LNKSTSSILALIILVVTTMLVILVVLNIRRRTPDYPFIPVTFTPSLTDTPVPTNTPLPTKTRIPPTATVPAPDKSVEYLNGVQVVYIDTFSNPDMKGWDFPAGRIQNGELEVFGKDWVARKGQFKDGQGIIIDFSYTKGSVFDMFVDNGDFGTNPYKSFGVNITKNNIAMANVWSDNNWLGGAILSGNFTPKPDITYSLLIAILPKGEFLEVIWNPSDPSQTLYYRKIIDKNWSDLTWTFKFGAEEGATIFDNYREIKYESVK
jgi:hypothetical protein